ncbi:MAG: alpha/beta fold hydrolase [bacterium]
MNRKLYHWMIPVGLGFFTAGVAGWEAAAATIDNAQFPAHDPYLATLLSLNVQTESYPFLRHGRKRTVRLDQDQPAYPYMYWSNPNSSALAVVIPGLNGSCRDTTTAFLGMLLYAKGYSVAQISSPMHWTFIRAALSTPVPGYVPHDSLDAIRLIGRMVEDLEARRKKPFTYKCLAGQSFGALHTLFIADQEAREPQLRFDRFLAVNPLVDMQESVQKIDAMYSGSLQILRSLGPDRWNESLWFYHLSEVQDQPDKSALQKLDPLEAALAIGYLMKRNLTEFILASHEFKESGILSQPCGFFRRQPCYEEAGQFSFFRYVTDVVMKYSREFDSAEGTSGESVEALLQKNSLAAVADTLRNSPAVTVFHTQDDPLISPESAAFLQTVLPDGRLYLFRYGGHLGEIVDPQFRQKFQEAARIP